MNWVLTSQGENANAVSQSFLAWDVEYVFVILNFHWHFTMRISKALSVFVNLAVRVSSNNMREIQSEL